MALFDDLSTIFGAYATKINSLKSNLGNLANLNTSVKTSIVDAINAAKADIDDAKAGLDALEPGLPYSAKLALLECLSHVAWRDDEDAKYYYAKLKNTLFDNSALDEIAYGTLTYRDIFVLGNIIQIGDFEDCTISSTRTTLPNGDEYRINAGSPVITTELADSGNKSLKSFGTSSTQISYYHYESNASIFANKKVLCCARIKTARYVKGISGVQINIAAVKESQNILPKIVEYNLENNKVTSDFVSCVALLAPNLSALEQDYSIITFGSFIGTISSADLDNYIDNVVVCLVPDTMDLATATTLYNHYIDVLKAD